MMKGKKIIAIVLAICAIRAYPITAMANIAPNPGPPNDETILKIPGAAELAQRAERAEFERKDALNKKLYDNTLKMLTFLDANISPDDYGHLSMTRNKEITIWVINDDNARKIVKKYNDPNVSIVYGKADYSKAYIESITQAISEWDIIKNNPEKVYFITGDSFGVEIMLYEDIPGIDDVVNSFEHKDVIKSCGIYEVKRNPGIG